MDRKLKNGKDLKPAPSLKTWTAPGRLRLVRPGTFLQDSNFRGNTPVLATDTCGSPDLPWYPQDVVMSRLDRCSMDSRTPSRPASESGARRQAQARRGDPTCSRSELRQPLTDGCGKACSILLNDPTTSCCGPPRQIRKSQNSALHALCRYQVSSFSRTRAFLSASLPFHILNAWLSSRLR